MSKKRKTKKEKMISSLRRQVIVENTSDSLTPSYSFKLDENQLRKLQPNTPRLPTTIPTCTKTLKIRSLLLQSLSH